MTKDQLTPADAGRYEAALDILAELIGHSAGRITDGRTTSNPGQTVIERWRSRQAEWIARRRDLDPRDHAAVQDVLERDGAVLRSLIEGRTG